MIAPHDPLSQPEIDAMKQPELHRTTKETGGSRPTPKRPVSYIVITPARDEEANLPRLVESMVSQTVPPLAWVIVDDGSTDRTGDIADQAANEHDWIRVLHRDDRGRRQAGSGVVHSFYDGLALVEDLPWEFVVKLDGDLSFEEDYFACCFEQFAEDEKLGIGGGAVSLRHGDYVELECKVDPKFHVRGPTKLYRRDCWEDIGGLVPAAGWDTVDEVKANMLGWSTRTFPEIPLIHNRPTGQAYGKWNDMMKLGRANFVAGYHPIFMLVKCGKRLFCRPYLMGGLALLVGYVGCYFKNIQRIPDKEVIRYFQDQQMRLLLFRKCLWR